MRKLVILASVVMAPVLAGCFGVGTARNDFKGQQLSAVEARLGPPEQQQVIAGRTVYTWFKGQTLNPCVIRVAMAGDFVDSYETTGDPNICAPWEAVPDKNDPLTRSAPATSKP